MHRHLRAYFAVPITDLPVDLAWGLIVAFIQEHGIMMDIRPGIYNHRSKDGRNPRPRVVLRQRRLSGRWTVQSWYYGDVDTPDSINKAAWRAFEAVEEKLRSRIDLPKIEDDGSIVIGMDVEAFLRKVAIEDARFVMGVEQEEEEEEEEQKQETNDGMNTTPYLRV